MAPKKRVEQKSAPVPTIANLTAADEDKTDEYNRVIWKSCSPHRISETLKDDGIQKLVEALNVGQAFSHPYRRTAIPALLEFAAGYDETTDAVQFRGKSILFDVELVRSAFGFPNNNAFPLWRNTWKSPVLKHIFPITPPHANPYSLERITKELKDWVPVIRLVLELLLGKSKPTQLTERDMYFFFAHWRGLIPTRFLKNEPEEPHNMPDWAKLVHDSLRREILGLRYHVSEVRKGEYHRKRHACYCGTAVTWILKHLKYGVDELNAQCVVEAHPVETDMEAGTSSGLPQLRPEDLVSDEGEAGRGSRLTGFLQEALRQAKFDSMSNIKRESVLKHKLAQLEQDLDREVERGKKLSVELESAKAMLQANEDEMKEAEAEFRGTLKEDRMEINELTRENEKLKLQWTVHMGICPENSIVGPAADFRDESVLAAVNGSQNGIVRPATDLRDDCVQLPAVNEGEDGIVFPAADLGDDCVLPSREGEDCIVCPAADEGDDCVLPDNQGEGGIVCPAADDGVDCMLPVILGEDAPNYVLVKSPIDSGADSSRNVFLSRCARQISVAGWVVPYNVEQVCADVHGEQSRDEAAILQPDAIVDVSNEGSLELDLLSNVAVNRSVPRGFKMRMINSASSSDLDIPVISSVGPGLQGKKRRRVIMGEEEEVNDTVGRSGGESSRGRKQKNPRGAGVPRECNVEANEDTIVQGRMPSTTTKIKSSHQPRMDSIPLHHSEPEDSDSSDASLEAHFALLRAHLNVRASTTPSASKFKMKATELKKKLDDSEVLGSMEFPEDYNKDYEGHQELGHQKKGLKWMHDRELGESSPVGGNLLDEQGMGKTVAVILLCLKNRAPAGRPTLIVCPVAVLQQWSKEIEEKTNKKLSVMIYHESTVKTANKKILCSSEVVLTTYDTVASTAGLMSKAQRKKAQKSGSTPGALFDIEWFRIVLDECQVIRSHDTIRAMAVCSLKAERRWCLSGTPIQNVVQDMYSYFKFLQYEDLEHKNKFDTLVKQQPYVGGKRSYGALVQHWNAISLRRVRDKDLAAEHQLPPKTEEIIYVEFNDAERQSYKRVYDESQETWNVYAQERKVGFGSVLASMMKVRQKSVHPDLHLLPKLLKKTALPDAVKKDLLFALQQMTETTVWCQCNEGVSGEVHIAKCHHFFCEGCATDPLERCGNCKRKVTTETLYTLEECSFELGKSNWNSRADMVKSTRESLFAAMKTSSKIDAVISYLTKEVKYRAVLMEGTVMSVWFKEKTLLFSQWTSALDIMEHFLIQERIHTRRVDGGMKPKIRVQQLNEFQSDPSVAVLLCSLKATNVGLNITCANHVLFLDAWWNPTMELQAIGRAVRMGQKLPVQVRRFINKETIDLNIRSIQVDKLDMIQGIMDSTNSEVREMGIRMGQQIFGFKTADQQSSDTPSISGSSSAEEINSSEADLASDCSSTTESDNSSVVLGDSENSE